MPARRTPEDPWRARIWSLRGDFLGSGVLLSGRHVLTCAHVVEAGAASEPAGSVPDVEVEIDFPEFKELARTRSRIAADGWIPIEQGPDGRGDIAILELEAEPDAITPAALSFPSSHAGLQVRTWGYHKGVTSGIWVDALAGKRTPAGWVQLETTRSTGFGVAQGFSGAGVADEATGMVVGIIVADLEDPSAKIAFMLPMETILECWPRLADRTVGRDGSVTISPLSFAAVAECRTQDGHEISAVTGPGALLRRRWSAEGGWSHWCSFPARQPVRDVAATSFAPGRMTCVIVDGDGRAARSSSANGDWTSWHTMSAPDDTRSPVLVRVAAVSKCEKHHEIFAVTAAGELIHRWGWQREAFDPWQQMDTPEAVFDVAATSSADDQMQVFVTDRHGRAWRRSAVGSEWADTWHRMRLPGSRSPALTRIAAISGWPGHQEVFAVTATGELVHRWWWESSDWEKWYTKPTPVPVCDVAAVSNTDGHIECVITGTDGSLWQQHFDGDWSPFWKMSGGTGQTPCT